MLTRDAFENITFQKSRVRAEIGATFEEFVVKMHLKITNQAINNMFELKIS